MNFATYALGEIEFFDGIWMFPRKKNVIKICWEQSLGISSRIAECFMVKKKSLKSLPVTTKLPDWSPRRSDLFQLFLASGI